VWDFALRRLWAAFGLQRATTTIGGPSAIEDSLPSWSRVRELALRAHMDIAIVEREVLLAQ
jgi:hypothetical protein